MTKQIAMARSCPVTALVDQFLHGSAGAAAGAGIHLRFSAQA
ncbi:hypothetical protein VXQ18_05065 [Brucella abortus]|nr:hypothetical protein [Brucella abortus]